MKKALKSIAKSMKTLARCQLRNNAMYADSLTYSWENLQINREHLKHSRDTNRITLKRFELEHAPLISVKLLRKMQPLPQHTEDQQNEKSAEVYRQEHENLS